MKKIFILTVTLLLCILSVKADCTDTDFDAGYPGEFFEAGTCIDDDGDHADYCSPEGHVQEYRCYGTGYCGLQTGYCNNMAIEAGYDGNYKCENGECVETSEIGGYDLEIKNFRTDESIYKGKKIVTIFVDIHNKGTAISSYFDLKFKINGIIEEESRLKGINPQESITESVPFEAKDGSNSIEIEITETNYPLQDADLNNNVLSKTLTYSLDQDECSSNSDCDDSDKSTIDICSGTPKECSNTEITECVSGDDYCPQNCDYINDEDCTEPDHCSTNNDCNDKDISTKDVCSGIPKKCTNIKIIECAAGDDYCPPNCNYEQDKDCSEPDECSNDIDCNDNNACTSDRCSGKPKKCSNERTSSGCDLNDNCVPIGTRTEDKFCDVDNSFKDQKTKEVSCNNYYECESNICVNSNCIEPNFIQKILNWFKRLFS